MTQDIRPGDSATLQVTPDSLPIYRSYLASPYLSIKHSSYFQVYSDLLEKYRGTTFTFVEIGVLNGGSLFMWRDFFGEKARIIGIDLNPEAARWEKDGFEIFIGSQSEPSFWTAFFEEVGMVDVVLDDGGHTYEQQIVTAHCCIPKIKDGGQLIVEDTHTSYFEDFGYPSGYTFMEWVKKILDNINGRCPAVNPSSQPYSGYIYSVRAFESIVSFEIDRGKCFTSQPTRNLGKSVDAEDYRHVGTNAESLAAWRKALGRRFDSLKSLPLVRPVVGSVFTRLHRALSRANSGRIKRYF